MDEIFVRLINFPYGVGGTTVTDNDGDYNVYINARESYNQQKETLNHELSHISHDHFYDGRSVEEDESEAEAEEDQKVDPSVLTRVHWGGYVSCPHHKK